ncbi:MAG: putative Ig domain-containing protein [Candidatus Aureabacteria bacterium]|nr:putative Ig domain-containing protein [Candidatus Auribacterota bacterium]
MKLWKIAPLCLALALLWIALAYFHQPVQKAPQRPLRIERRREANSYRTDRTKNRSRNLTPIHADALLASVFHEDRTTGNAAIPPPQKTEVPHSAPTAERAKEPTPGNPIEPRAADEAASRDHADPTPPPFVIVTTKLPTAFVGASYSASLVAEGGTSPYIWSLPEGALPKGLSLDGSKGIVSGTPQSPGTAQLSLKVIDAARRSASASCALEVREQGGILVPMVAGLHSQPLYLITGTLPQAKVGEAYRSQFAATGGTPPYLWSIHTGSLPEGITLERLTGSLTGTPSTPQLAVFQVKVVDSEAHADIAENRIVVVGPELVIATISIETGTVGSPYEQKLEATGGAPPYSWNISSGTLPGGLSLDAGSGLISGTPTEHCDTLLAVQVSDSQGAMASEELELLVASSSLAVVTESLPQGELNKAYAATLAAGGGVTPYKWSLTVGQLPPGLTLNQATGIIGGTPSGGTGDYGLTFSVTDQEGTQASRALTLSIVVSSTLMVTDLNAVPSDQKVGLTWSNPAAKDYSRTVVLRSSSYYPSGAGDGTVIYSGSGDSYLDTGLQNGASVYYAAIAYATSGAPGVIAESSKTCAMPQAVTLSGAADPFADAVASFQPLSPGGFGSGNLSCVLGPPFGGGVMRGSTHVVSLHARANEDGGASAPYGGSITLQFTNNIVVNGPGPDFIIFENVFYAGGDPQQRWMEPAIVAVSRDGSRYYTFPYDFVPHYTASGEINCYNPYCYSKGFAGVNPVFSNGGSPDPRAPSAAGGDAFDLSKITQVSLDWIRYVRITATGDNWLTDMNGDRVRHVRDTGACSGGGSSGFDLDAICAINY